MLIEDCAAAESNNFLKTEDKVAFLEDLLEDLQELVEGGRVPVKAALIDFGQATRFNPNGIDEHNFLYDRGFYNAILNTSPSQFGQKNYSEHPTYTDLFALGCCMYVWRTGADFSWTSDILKAYQLFISNNYEFTDPTALINLQRKMKTDFKKFLENPEISLLFKMSEANQPMTKQQRYDWLMYSLLLANKRKLSASSLLRTLGIDY